MKHELQLLLLVLIPLLFFSLFAMEVVPSKPIVALSAKGSDIQENEDDNGSESEFEVLELENSVKVYETANFDLVTSDEDAKFDVIGLDNFSFNSSEYALVSTTKNSEISLNGNNFNVLEDKTYLYFTDSEKFITLERDLIDQADEDLIKYLESEEFALTIKTVGLKNIDVESITDFTPPELVFAGIDEEAFEVSELPYRFEIQSVDAINIMINGEQVDEVRDSELYMKSLNSSMISEGDNEITIDAIDMHGNKLSKKITLNYTKPEPVVATESVESLTQENPKSNSSNNNKRSKVHEETSPAPPKTPQPEVQSPYVSKSCSVNYRNQLLGLINNYRSDNGLSTLSLDSSLNQASCNHSSWMNDTGIFSHTGYNSSSFRDRCSLVGTTCWGENLATANNLSAQQIFNMWKNSPSHNENMLGDYSVIGFGEKGSYITTLYR